MSSEAIIEKPRAMRDAFLERTWRAMADDKKIFFLSADFGSPVLDKIRADHPDRFINVGVAEQSLINVTAGLALEGFKVFAYAIAPFITMRCYEQTRISLALLSELRSMNVTLIGVGAGYSYVLSGPTHQCYEDLTLMRALPNFRVLSPSDHVTADAMFDACHTRQGLKYLRFDAQILPTIYAPGGPDIARGFHVHRQGGPVCLVATGYMLHTARKAAEALATNGVEVGVIDMFDLSGFDAQALAKALAPYRGVLSLEEGFRGRGGLDAMMSEFLASAGLDKKLLGLGVTPGYRFELGARDVLHEAVGIGLESVIRGALELNDAVGGSPAHRAPVASEA